MSETFPSWIWSVLAALLFFPVLVRVMTWFAARGIRLQPGSHRPASGSDPAEWERELFGGADSVLAAMGYRFAGYGLNTEEIAGTPCAHHEAYHVHASGLAWAVVRPAHHPSPQCPFLIAWFTACADGTVLWTRNLDPAFGDDLVPWLKPADRYEASWEAAAALHRDRVAEAATAGPPRILTLEDLIALRDQACREAWSARAESGRMTMVREGVGRLDLAGAWAAARTMNRFRAPLFKAYQAWLRQATEFPLSPRAEAECYRRSQRVVPEAGGWGKALLVIASLGAASLLWGETFTPAFAAVFVAVLFVHELGHALAMRLVGYQDVNIFFIPFFGAMATGKPGKVLHPWQEALVLLAGPLPGLIAGAWLFNSSLAGSHPIVHQAGLLALTINGLNLLPISPLDGGRILDLVLFRRAPKLGMGFLILSASTLIAGAVAATDAILALVGGSILLGAGRAYRQARILWEVRKEREAGQADAAADPAEDLFRRLRKAGGKPMAFIHKLSLMKGMLASLHTRAPGAWAIAGILALYVGAWIVPLAVMAVNTPGAVSLKDREVTREALLPAERDLYDRICEDTAVVHIRAYRWGERPSFDVFCISTTDTSRLRSWYDTSSGAKVDLVLDGPIWEMGMLDSTLGAGLVSPWETGADMYSLPDDSVAAREARYDAQVDSVRALEEKLWKSWSPDRRMAMLIALEEKTRAGKRPWNCWKGP